MSSFTMAEESEHRRKEREGIAFTMGYLTAALDCTSNVYDSSSGSEWVETGIWILDWWLREHPPVDYPAEQSPN
jgi:hypothetical protein